MESEAKHQINCDFCGNTISLPNKGKSKEGKEVAKYEPIPLSAILEHGIEGDTREYHTCDEKCLRGLLNERNAKVKKKSKSKASLDCDVILHRKW